MTQKKTEISDRERERRARQAADAQQKGQHGPQIPGQGAKQSGYHPSNLVARHTKSTGRGT